MLDVRAAAQDRARVADPAARRALVAIPALVAVLLAAILASLCLGRFHLPMRDILSVLFPGPFPAGPGSDLDMASTVIRQVRLPRVACAILVGGALSASDAAYQGVFRNPMVSPDILGASAGAGFGAALAILLSLPAAGIQGFAFAFGVAAVAVSCAVSARFGRGQGGTVVLILSGMVVATLFSSGLSIAKYVADPDNKLPAITFWLMGSLASTSPKDVAIVGIPAVLGAIPLLLARWRLNVLSLGDEEARALGVDTARIRWMAILCSTLMTASSISICGMVGWVGLKIPHIARMLVGPDFTALLPVATLLGATYLLLVDDIARTACPMEIPLGILTALLGAPFFLWLLSRGRRGWIS